MGFLKLLELENFKSYKGHQVVGPFHRFSAIIGPNGSGKSNLMDAISFVLGERTQHLRVKSLKDLIHGAPIGKPVARSAKVAIVYEDNDGTEITFARVIHGAGSEYKVDGKVVPQNVYHERLQSVGIYLKGKNCLVFQGAVESIAMKSAKELTKLFEDISGSGELASDYEGKKVAMQQAQEMTNLTFNKKKLIFNERKAAKAEKEEAEKYEQLQKDYEEAVLQEKLFHLYHLEASIEGSSEAITETSRTLEKLLKKRDKLEHTIKSKRQETAKWTREVALIDKRMRETEVKMNQGKPLYIKAKEKTSHVANRLEATKKALKKALEKVQHNQDHIATLESELSDVRQRLEDYEEEVTQQSQDEGLQLVDSQLTEYHQLQTVVEESTGQLNQKLARIESEKRSSSQALETLKIRREQLLNMRSKIETRRESHVERAANLGTEISSTNEKVNKLRQDESALSRDIDSANARYQVLTDSLGQIQKSIGEMDGDQQESRRKKKKAETLETLKRLFPGVLDSVLSMCEPVHQKYSVAVTKVFGKNMDAVIVDNSKTGWDCIQYLKEQRSEPMTFIPLEDVEVKPINESFRSLGGTSHLIFDVIKIKSPEVKKAIMFVCNNAVVCDTVEEARRVAFDSRERKRVVSLDGTLFQKNGQISGGSHDVRNRAKAFSDKKYDDMVRKRERHMTDLRVVIDTRRRQPDLNYLRDSIASQERKLKQIRKDKQLIEDQIIPDVDRELDRVSGDLEAIEPEIAESTKITGKVDKEIGKIEREIASVEDQVYREFCASIGVSNIREFEEVQVKGQQMRNQKRLEFSELITKLENQLSYEKQRAPHTEALLQKHKRTIRDDKTAMSALKEDESEKLSAIEEMEAHISELQAQKEEIRSRYTDKEVEVTELRKMMSSQTKEISDHKKRINSLETELDQKRASRHGLLKSCKMESVTVPLVRGSMDNIDEEPATSQQQPLTSQSSSTRAVEINSLSSQGARVLYEREETIVIDFSLLSDELKQVDADEESTMSAELDSRVSSLKDSLSRTTAPNLRAKHKLEDIEARFKDTTSEFDKSRQISRKTKTEFERVKDERCGRFNKALEHISAVIDPTYKKLSNSVSAQAIISPEDAEEPYQDGILYNCIAPGKRYRPMENLSGGEKTIAALALLFSIHNFQNSPFFVLDEIDAALDNTNINRVARYIMEKAADKTFQCIVISLKEEFYSHADAIVGIYSPLGGECTVSTVVTLDLTPFPDVTEQK